MKRIYITVDVEEWFHTEWIETDAIIRQDTDIVETTQSLADLFSTYKVEATFFVLGETAYKYPELLNIIQESGHEIACHGYYHRQYQFISDFRKDIKKFKKEISSTVTGFRIPNFNISEDALHVIKEEGFEYDSSVVPCWNIPGWYGNPQVPLHPYRHDFGKGKEYIKEIPVSVYPYLRLPGAGGWYLRNCGYSWTYYLVMLCLRKVHTAVLYIHPWEISNNNPKIKGVPGHIFRNTGDVTFNRIENLIKSFSQYTFCRLDTICRLDTV
jgi:polysaccharide deacetylase family protein (PEP-CTERM system associated)